MLISIFNRVDGFLSEAGAWPTDSEINECLRTTSGYSPGGGVAVPLGDKGGVPTLAADVHISEVLASSHPEAARQARDPSALLLPLQERPLVQKKCYSRLHKSYPKLVQRTCASGLQRLVRGRHVWKHAGKRMVGGAFGICKSETEDRFISALPVNQLVDPKRVLRPRFGYPPLLRTLKAKRGCHLVVRKRDLRHYFHHLRLGRKWHKYLAHPSAVVDGEPQYPLHQAAGMSFAPSAGLAQSVTDLGTAALPREKRVVFDAPAPKAFPVWGSIIDDLWTVEQRQGRHQSDPLASAWIRAGEKGFEKLGVSVHHGKSEDNGFGAEFQGAQIHSTQHWLGTTVRRLLLSTPACFTVLGRWEVASLTVERLNGKQGYDDFFRPCIRSVKQTIYGWMEAHRDARRSLRSLPSAVWGELAVSAVLAPLKQANLQAAYCRRVECYDAAPGGHGRAWVLFPEDTVHTICRLADGPGVRTSLREPSGMVLTQEGRCPLARVRLPASPHWHTVSRPGGYRHITLEEADANVWAVESKLHRPAELGTKSCLDGDNAPCVGAFRKGRSGAPLLNARCRRRCAAELAGDLGIFDFWISTHVNPADKPSRSHLPRSEKEPQPPPSREIVLAANGNDDASASLDDGAVLVAAPPGAWAQSGLLFIHFCSGPRRPDDLCAQVEKLALDAGYLIGGWNYDPVVDPKCDLA